MVIEAIPVLVGDAVRRVRRVVRYIAEEWPIAIRLDEGDRLVGQIVGDVAFAAHGLAIVFKRRIEVFAPMPGREAVVFLEAARVGMVGPLAAVVPFAERAGAIAEGAKNLSESCLVQVK